ncbi:MAG: DUF1015 domain-containing protein [Candidatus Hydrogenedentota bacterium]
MADIQGFRGFRYNRDKAGSFDAVITPPFDVISPEEREELASRSPYNYVHLILPQEENGTDKYEVAARRLDAWIQEQVFVQDPEDSMYLLEQRFEDQEGKEHVRHGFFAAVKIPEPGEETVLGHEQTFRHKIEDRLSLTKACRANLGAVFVSYADPEGNVLKSLQQAAGAQEDIAATTIDGVRLRLWRVPALPEVMEFFKGETLYIADGHHRFTTACAYRDDMRAAEQPDGLRPYDYVLMGLVAMEDPGFVVFPAHRVLNLPKKAQWPELLQQLGKWFEVREADSNVAWEVKQTPGCAIGVVRGDGARHILTLRDGVDREEMLGGDHGPAWRDLDVSVLHRGILENIVGVPEGAEFVYEPDPVKAIGLVEQGEKDTAFILKPTLAKQIKACADAREFMPQKSTYLFPKLPSGAVFYRHK